LFIFYFWNFQIAADFIGQLVIDFLMAGQG